MASIKEICRETGVVIFCVHHHSKGAAFYKNASSRASGSGMLQRAFSTLLDLSEVDSDLPDGVHGFEFSGQPRQAASFKMNLLFDYPLWQADEKHLLPDNALNKKRTAAARSHNGNNQKAEEVRKNLPSVLNRVFTNNVKKDESGEYVTIGDVIDEFAVIGIKTSETAISRKIDDGIPGFKRDPTPGKRRLIRMTDFEPVSKIIVPDVFLPETP